MFNYERHEDRSDNRQNQKCCWCLDSSLTRFVALVFITVTGFLLKAIFYFPEGLHVLISKSFKINTYQLDYLNFFFVIPSVLWCLMDGIIIDRLLGLKLGCLIFSAIAFLGQVIITAGSFVELYWLMLLGRVVNSFGTEAINVSLHCFCIQWFQLYELNFSFGLLQSITSLGSFIPILISESFQPFAERTVTKSNILGVCMTPFLLMSLIQLLTVALLVYKTYLHQTSYVLPNNQTLGRIVTFPHMFWLITMMLVFICITTTSFPFNSKRILTEKYHLSKDEVSEFKGLFFLLSSLTPCLPGILADFLGRNVFFIIFGLLAGVISQFLITFTDCSPYIPIVLLALNFSILNSCSLPLVSYVVDSHQLATCYGILRSSMYFISILSNFLALHLLNNYGPFAVTLYFTITLLLALVCSLIIYSLDNKSSGILNMSVFRRRILLQTTQI